MGEDERGNREILSESPLISIIVPVYQVKDYIRECVESLLAQTYRNLEILLVDDGSTDGSEVICDEYAVRDSRVRVIHQENQGLSGARNTGLEYAKGVFIAFVDSDDVVLADFIEIMYGLLKKYQADISACAYIKCQTEELKWSIGAIKDGLCRSGQDICMTSEQMLRQWHGKYKRWETVAWNKLYRRSVLEGGNGNELIRFPVGMRHEDVLVSHLIIRNANKIVLTNRELYLYRIRENSITAGMITANNRKLNLMVQRERMRFFKEKRYWRAYLNLIVGYVLHLVWFGWKSIARAVKTLLNEPNREKC